MEIYPSHSPQTHRPLSTSLDLENTSQPLIFGFDHLELTTIRPSYMLKDIYHQALLCWLMIETLPGQVIWFIHSPDLVNEDLAIYFALSSIIRHLITLKFYPTYLKFRCCKFIGQLCLNILADVLPSEHRLDTLDIFEYDCQNLTDVSHLNLNELIIDRSASRFCIQTANISHFQSLQTLSLNWVHLDRFSSTANLSTLKSLDLSYNHIRLLTLTHCESLIFLNCAHNHIDRWPVPMSDHCSLTELDLAYNRIITACFERHSRNIRSLNLSNNPLSCLPKNLLYCHCCESLNLSNSQHQLDDYQILHHQVLNIDHSNIDCINPVEHDENTDHHDDVVVHSHLIISNHTIAAHYFYNTLGEITRLRTLALTHLDLIILPSAFDHLINLNTLILAHNKLCLTPKKLTSILEKLESLTHLDLSYNESVSVPPVIQHDELIHLDLSCNPLEACTLYIISVQCFGLILNRIQMQQIRIIFKNPIPYSTDYYSGLTLSIHNGHQSSFPDWMVNSSLPGNLQPPLRLLSLDISHNLITALPDELLVLKPLQRLILDHNRLTSLSSSIAVLGNLKYLSAAHNHIQCLDPEAFQPCDTGVFNQRYLCQTIENIILKHNHLKSIPSSIINCETLTYLDCSCNQAFFLSPISPLPPNLITLYLDGTSVQPSYPLYYLLASLNHIEFISLPKSLATYSMIALAPHCPSIDNPIIVSNQPYPSVTKPGDTHTFWVSSGPIKQYSFFNQDSPLINGRHCRFECADSIVLLSISIP
ncbi:MAG: hypothetical protein VXY77_03365 [Pseudomonadota bacterium]|nr:hypothetical protein [Pseudomonadota bacterium]